MSNRSHKKGSTEVMWRIRTDEQTTGSVEEIPHETESGDFGSVDTKPIGGISESGHDEVADSIGDLRIEFDEAYGQPLSPKMGTESDKMGTDQLFPIVGTMQGDESGVSMFDDILSEIEDEGGFDFNVGAGDEGLDDEGLDFEPEHDASEAEANGASEGQTHDDSKGKILPKSGDTLVDHELHLGVADTEATPLEEIKEQAQEEEEEV
ncbi:hypothetical protein GF354_03840, partial [Candidatus Peregrinibacteria bacterium]|nr:hypothetical protein [Candidatus Peregrinibacteria bacterium]